MASPELCGLFSRAEAAELLQYERAAAVLHMRNTGRGPAADAAEAAQEEADELQ